MSRLHRDSRRSLHGHRSDAPDGSRRSGSPDVERIEQLQRGAGNLATQRVLGRAAELREASRNRRLMRADDASPLREVQRLEGEFSEKLKKSAWMAIVRLYRQIEDHGWELAQPKTHLAAAVAEKTAIGVSEHYETVVNRAVDTGADGAQQELDELRARYRKVRIRPGGFLGGLLKGRPSFACEVMPFDQIQRKTVLLAIEHFEGSKKFEGFLPLGTYLLNEQPVEVTEGSATLELTY